MAFPLLRDSVRLIRRNPVLSLVAILSLAIGITINATAFSLIDGLVLRPLPIADPAGLIVIRTVSTSGGADGVSFDDFRDVQESAKTSAPALISHRYWQRKLAGDPHVIGRSIRLNTRAWTIVGVLPEHFGGTQPLLPPAIWVPIDAFVANGRSAGTRGDRSVVVLGRLASGVTMSHANAELRRRRI